MIVRSAGFYPESSPDEAAPVFIIEVDKWPDDGVWVGTCAWPRVQVVNRVDADDALRETKDTLESALNENDVEFEYPVLWRAADHRPIRLIPVSVPE